MLSLKKLLAAGLILPGVLRIRPELTPLAAVGLVIIMIGATVITLMGVAMAPAQAAAVSVRIYGLFASAAGAIAYLDYRRRRRALREVPVGT